MRVQPACNERRYRLACLSKVGLKRQKSKKREKSADSKSFANDDFSCRERRTTAFNGRARRINFAKRAGSKR